MLHTDLAFTHTNKNGLWAACYKLLGGGLDSLLSRVETVSMASRARSERTSAMLEIYLETSSQNWAPALAGSVSISLEDWEVQISTLLDVSNYFTAQHGRVIHTVEGREP